MGFDPFRKHRPSAVDLLLVVGAVALAVAVMVWALLAS
jgi:hypothetical protein